MRNERPESTDEPPRPPSGWTKTVHPETGLSPPSKLASVEEILSWRGLQTPQNLWIQTGMKGASWSVKRAGQRARMSRPGHPQGGQKLSTLRRGFLNHFFIILFMFKVLTLSISSQGRPGALQSLL